MWLAWDIAFFFVQRHIITGLVLLASPFAFFWLAWRASSSPARTNHLSSPVSDLGPGHPASGVRPWREYPHRPHSPCLAGAG